MGKSTTRYNILAGDVRPNSAALKAIFPLAYYPDTMITRAGFSVVHDGVGFLENPLSGDCRRSGGLTGGADELPSDRNCARSNPARDRQEHIGWHGEILDGRWPCTIPDRTAKAPARTAASYARSANSGDRRGAGTVNPLSDQHCGVFASMQGDTRNLQADTEVFTFGSFRLMPKQRTLLSDGKPLHLGSRALDILVMLVEKAGETVSHNDLIARTWPDTNVAEASLRVNIAALRKTLGGRSGDRFIINVPGRGYIFVAPVTREHTGQHVDVPSETVRGNDTPASLNRIIGRDAVIPALAEQLGQCRFLTIVGPGGIGKTTIAAAVAEAVRASHADGVWFVGLASLTNPELVPNALGAVFGIPFPAADPISGLTAWLRNKQAVIVLDNCEHVIEAAAALAEEIVRSAPRTCVLATSREPLRAQGEWQYRLAPLEFPSNPIRLAASEALQYPAVQLFNERALASVDGFVIGDGDIPAIVEICHKLDGVPLALELAAAHVGVLGIKGLAARLDDRLALLVQGRRTALPRHQTLRATLDWSYDLLPETERCLLRHLAIFAGGFTPDGVAAVTSGANVPVGDSVETIANLFAKSLIVRDGSGSLSRWRMLDTIRTYSLEKLKAHNEFEAASRRHAKYHSDLFGQARSDWECQPTAAWLSEYGYRLDDLRAALDWAFSSGGDAALGLALTADAVPLWLQCSLMGECRRRIEQALSYIEAETSENARLRLRLRTALSLSRMYTGDKLSDMTAAWSVTLDLAESVGDPDYQLRAIWGLFAGSFNSGDFRAALDFAERFCRVATDAAGRLIGERLVGTALHILGDQKNARRHMEHMLAGYTAPATSSHIIRYQNDQVIAARRVLAPILWLQGYPDQAMRMVQNTVADTLALDHALTLCNLLAQAACPLAFLTGDLAAANRFTTILVEQATRYSLDVWRTYGHCFEGLLLIREGNVEHGLSRMRDAGSDLRQAGFLQYYTPYLGLLAEALAVAGHVAPGLAAIDEALERAERTEERWCLADLLRVKGELLLKNADGDYVAAEGCFQNALKVSREQDALSWELRAALSLSGVRMAQRRRDDARNLLAPVYDRFTEGFGTADLKAATALLVTMK